ncbi:MAG: BrnT family toxin [Candidatus Binataceae bacterium]
MGSLDECEGLQWDAGNAVKIWERHRVTPAECEELFFNRPLIVGEDDEHSAVEARMYGLGQTDAGRFLFVAFTIRGKLIRVVSARDMSRKERRIYHSS